MPAMPHHLRAVAPNRQCVDQMGGSAHMKENETKRGGAGVLNLLSKPIFENFSKAVTWDSSQPAGEFVHGDRWRATSLSGQPDREFTHGKEPMVCTIAQTLFGIPPTLNLALLSLTWHATGHKYMSFETTDQ